MDAFGSTGLDAFRLNAGGHRSPAPAASPARIPFAVSPVAAAFRGLGQDAPPDAAAPLPAALPAPSPARMLLGLAFLGGVGFLSYQVGKAVAPTAAKQNTWGWIAVPAGLFAGPIGLGLMALVANYERNS